MPDIGDTAPLFSANDFLGGGTFSLADHQGEVVLIAFNGITWCAPCQFEAPILASLWEEFQGSNVQFVMISVNDSPGGLSAQLQEYGISMPVLTDPAIPSLYGISGVPALFILDTDLKICAIKVGASPPEDVLREEIRQLLIGCGASEPKPKVHLDHWVAAARILFGVIGDGGGLGLTPGGKPIPIDPWGPLRRLAVEKRDAVIAIAISELARQINDSKARLDLETRSLRAAESAVKKLLLKTGRKPVSFDKDRMPVPETPTKKA